MSSTFARLDSQVTLEFLWKLRYGTTIDSDLNGFEYFEADFGFTVRDSVEQLVRQGHLTPVDAARYLERQTATQLREILRSCSLKLTGKKADLISRLLQEATTVAEELARESQLLVPSEDAWAAIQAYRESRKADRATSHHAALDALKAGDYQRAVEIAREFDSREYFQRYKPEPDPPAIAREASNARYICVARPRLLADIPEPIAREVAPVAAVSQLFGCSIDQILRLLPELPPARFEPLDILLLYQRSGHHQAQLARFRQDGIVTHVCIRSIGDHRDSDICRADDGNVYSLDCFPELPHPQSDKPCGCMLTAYFPGLSKP